VASVRGSRGATLASLMLPLMRFAPPVYHGQVRRRIYPWYGNLRTHIEFIRRLVEEKGAAGPAAG
jgi:hypothetical protein